VDFSIRYLVQQFEVLGACRRELVVKLFGGADVLPVAETSRERPTVGAQNCIVAAEVLAEEGLTVSASDIGGRSGRIIHFHTGTGEVLLRRLPPAARRAGKAGRSIGELETYANGPA
jgi:chemotaxis protein CheD